MVELDINPKSCAFFYSYSDVNNLIVMFGRCPPYATMMVDIIGIVVNYITGLVNDVGLQEETVQRRLIERKCSGTMRLPRP